MVLTLLRGYMSAVRILFQRCSLVTLIPPFPPTRFPAPPRASSGWRDLFLLRDVALLLPYLLLHLLLIIIIIFVIVVIISSSSSLSQPF